MVGGLQGLHAQILQPDISAQQIVEGVAFKSDVLQPRVPRFIWIDLGLRYFEEHDSMIHLVVAHERKGGKRRPLMCEPRYRWDL